MCSETYNTKESSRLFDRARAVVPGGVNSPVRSFGVVGGTPRFIVKGSGAQLWDADGNRYIDLIASWGPAILGHAHPAVVEAVSRTALDGLSFGTPTVGEVELAEELVSRVAAVEQVRLVNSGTEAVMSAVRLARGFTGRRRIVKFAGHYHGHVDALLASAGSGVATFGLPGSSGVTQAQISDTIVLPYNDFDAVRSLFEVQGEEVACLIAEPASGNMGVVPPAPGFNQALREITNTHGALLIHDEVMTGFRVSSAGWYGVDPVEADLFTYGKVMSGGLPAAAFGGRTEIMKHLAPEGAVYQAGTLSGNPIAVAAGLATLRHATSEVYAALNDRAKQLRQMVTSTLTAEGVSHRVQEAGSMLSVFFGDADVTNFEQAQASETWRYPAFFHALLKAGVMLPPSPMESWFVSAALGDDELNEVANALPQAARAAAAAQPSPTTLRR